MFDTAVGLELMVVLDVLVGDVALGEFPAVVVTFVFVWSVAFGELVEFDAIVAFSATLAVVVGFG